ncbi:MAG: glycosyltransferase [Bacteroidales bacterium]
MDVLTLIINILQTALWIYLAVIGLYLLLFALSSLLPHKNDYHGDDTPKRIAVLIPGYKEDNIIVEIARLALQQNYPKDKYDVVIIADSFKPETLEALRKLPIKVIEVSFEISTKAKALTEAVKQLPDTYDLCIILDADNVMEPEFLQKISKAWKPGMLAIQGHRIAKNMNTPFAILDAISEEINNQVFRKGHRRLGLSAAIIGSGVAFDYKYFRDLIPQVTAVGGFDKEIELKMLRDRQVIYYLHDAYVYDEKVQKPETFQNQRRRWLSAQLHYLRKYFLHSLGYLIFKGNIEYFNKAFQFLQLPRVLLLGIVVTLFPLIIVLNFAINQPLWVNRWITLALIIIFAIWISVPRKFYNRNLWIALTHLPKGIFMMFLSLMKTKGANKRFIHTVHETTHTEIH